MIHANEARLSGRQLGDKQHVAALETEPLARKHDDKLSVTEGQSDAREAGLLRGKCSKSHIEHCPQIRLVDIETDGVVRRPPLIDADELEGIAPARDA